MRFLVVFTSFLLYLCAAAPAQSANNPCGAFKTFVNPKTNTTTCYHVEEKYDTWTEAEAYCVQRGAHLGSIHDAEFNNFVRNTFLGSFDPPGCHIGLSDTNPGSSGFTWSDGSILNYSNFGKGMPNPVLGHCLYMEIQNVPGTFQAAAWYSVGCDEEIMGWVCTRPAVF